MPRIEGKGKFDQARWRLVYAPQIHSLLSVDPTVDPLKSLANNILLGTEVEVQLGKRLTDIFQANSLICFLYCCNSHLIRLNSYSSFAICYYLEYCVALARELR
ncbi:hypothetical protein RchiOBHm_Chr4g0412921 [Rosa chinensis]|uniref:Uncharacterized protein n=1 Tax=Rosa chinensis TaxID=74649 RepID=A0A2P6QVY4_ROSCH|nr:hypothetical protein RchiOBHm_Chr4g0412921 [Rosa chinensis]